MVIMNKLLNIGLFVVLFHSFEQSYAVSQNGRDGTSVTLQCSANFIIDVTYAYYGSIGQNNPNLACADPNALANLKAQCDKKQTCTFTISDTIFSTTTCASFRREMMLSRYDCVPNLCTGYVCPNGGTCELTGLNAQPRCVDVPGPTYVRWGKTSCSSNTTKLYNGIMGGSRSDKGGGGANYLCLPSNPEYAPGVNGTSESKRGEIAGAEYTSDSSNFPFDAENKDIPCVVCQTIGKSSVFMYPAKRSCLDGWTVEYIGYLVSERDSSSIGRTSKGYECMDEDPDFINDGNDDNGAIIYVVEGRTKSLPTYTDYADLSCAVCSK